MSRAEYINFNKKVPILIYGAGEVGGGVGRKLIAAGYNVYAFLDNYKSGNEIITGKPIYRVDSKEIEIGKNNCIVFIGLADGMQHRTVALNLWENGFGYVVFIPMGFSIPNEKKIELCIQYNNILDGFFTYVDRIEIFCQYLQCPLNPALSIIMRQDEIYTVWVREELLYTELATAWQGDKNKVFTVESDQDINISTFWNYQVLFQFLQGLRDECGDYWKSSKLIRTAAEKGAIIGKREALYREYEREYSFGMSFFIVSAPKAVWNKKGYWNLHGGHHRTVFLQQKGNVLFPIKVSREDYDIWCNRDVFKRVTDYIVANGKKKTVVPIPHPAFLNFEAERELQGGTILAEIMRFMRGRLRKEMSILDCSDMEGYFSRNFSRLSMNRVVYCGKEIEYVKLLDELLYASNVDYVEKARNKGVIYSVVFVINRFDWNMSDLSFFNKLDRVVSKYLFLERTLGEALDPEEIVAGTSFVYYKVLHREIFQGKMREVNVFIK